MIAVVQPNLINSVGNNVTNFMNFNRPSTNYQGPINYETYNYPYQTQKQISFDTNLQLENFSNTLNRVDNGLNFNYIHTAQLANGSYFDFETGLVSSQYSTTADLYFTTSGYCLLTPQPNSLALNLGNVTFSSVDYTTYGNSILYNTLCGQQNTNNQSNLVPLTSNNVILWHTVEGNLVRVQISISGSTMALTYDNLYYLSIDGNQDLIQTANQNGWLGSGTQDDPYIISGYNISIGDIGGFYIANTDLYVTIANNKLAGQGSSSYGLFFSNTQNIAVDHNSITGYTVGVVVTNSYNLSFDTNIIAGSSEQGMLLSISQLIDIVNNKFQKNGYSAITAVFCLTLNIEGNNISYNAVAAASNPEILSSGITYILSYGLIFNNTLSHNVGYGALVLGTGLLNSNNTAKFPVRTNLDVKVKYVNTNGLDYPSRPCVVSLNTVEGNTLDGLAVISSDSVSLTNNTVNMNTQSGIRVSTSTNILLGGNTITSNGEDGITWIYSWYGIINENTIFANSNVVLLNSKSGSLSGYNTYSGMFIDPSFFNTITNNNISSNAFGVYLQGSDYNVFDSNHVMNNALNGISLINSSSNVISSNNVNGNSNPSTVLLLNLNLKTVGYNTYSGMFIDPSENNTVVNNDFSSNYGYGVHLTGSNNNTIDSNSANSNGLNGVFIENSNYTVITSNDFIGNGNPTLQMSMLNTFKPQGMTGYNTYSGMFIDPSFYNTVTNNNFDSNYGDGVTVSNSDSNNFGGNNLTNNAQNGLTIEVSSNNYIISNNLTGNGNPVLLSEILSFGKINGFTGYNTYSGMFIDPSSNNYVLNNDFSNNYGYGSWIQNSQNNVINGNSVNQNAADGVFVDNSNYNNITNNDIGANSNPVLQSAYLSTFSNMKLDMVTGYNTYSGMFIDPSVGNIVSGNTISNNPGNGLYVQESSQNSFESNVITNSGLNGFVLENSTYNNVTFNNITGSGNTAVLNTFLAFGKPDSLTGYNTYSGMFIDPSDNNYIAYNSITNNNGDGVTSQDSTGNTMYGNDISFNIIGFNSINSNANSLYYNSIVSNTNYGTYFDLNSHNSNVDHNDYVLNNLGTGNSQGYDDGGNNYAGNFFSDEIPGTPYLMDGSSGSQDNSVSTTPNTDLSGFNLPTLLVATYFNTHNLNVRSEGDDLTAWVYFPTGYSSYIVNKSSVSISWNGNSYSVEKVGTFGNHWLKIRIDRHQLSKDIYSYLKDNHLQYARITLTVTGTFKGGFMQFYGSNTINVFYRGNFHGDHYYRGFHNIHDHRDGGR